ncbi:CHAP domain-containing protein [Allorhizocola rhizosphaerae]|uniref:CHAP domain-containing protein n=1 Tax=Allorhizocola rhizosphaerae TaxID=1872709 RepID=UPI000E3C8B34|nr:CHAP domain-containing protein [Allorhizocola rhizosphaerae]
MRKTLTALAGITTVLAGAPAAAQAAQATPAGTDGVTAQSIGQAVVDAAYAEFNSDRNITEAAAGGANCNFYTNHWGLGSQSTCRSGYRSQEWCADFAKFVWKNAGVRDWSQTTAAANSFYRYGVNHGTWHAGTSGIRPGDAVVWDHDQNPANGGSGHVAIVVHADGSDIRVISGNFGGQITKHQLRNGWRDANIMGYTRPLA